jgi:S-adenosylmethionine-diacylglycerol 3-amino-3-carboxypropyl transferase
MNRLIYNQVWEDYEVDRRVFQAGSADRVLLIASGGCNVLNTLLEGPAEVVGVDHNSAQIDFTAQKIDQIRSGDHARLWNAYGTPAQERPGSVYARGAYGSFVWVRRFLRFVCGAENVRRLAEADSLREQARVYTERIEPRLWNLAVRTFPTALAMACGMHWRQAALAARAGQIRLERACRERMSRIMIGFPLRENYYWRQLLCGTYADNATAPPYLRADNFLRLRARLNRLQLHCADLQQFLETQPAARFLRVAALYFER